MINEMMPKIATLAILGVPAGVHAVLAEIPVPGAAPEWLGSVTQVSAFGLVAWIVYYMFTKWLPNIQAAHAAELTAQRVAHAEAMKTIADAHAAAINTMAKSFAENLQFQRADLIALIEREER